jgi:hypothetical protein
VDPRRRAPAREVAGGAPPGGDAPDRPSSERHGADREAPERPEQAEGQAADAHDPEGEASESHEPAGDAAEREEPGGDVPDRDDPAGVAAHLAALEVRSDRDVVPGQVADPPRRALADAAIGGKRSARRDRAQPLLELRHALFEVLPTVHGLPPPELAEPTSV